MAKIETAAIPNTLQDLVKSINIQVSGYSQFRRFQRMYSRDRIAFVYDCIPTLAKTIADYQIEILGYFDEGISRVAVRGPHGLGKTTLAAVLTHHSVLTSEEDCKVPTTASAWRQLEKYLWPEIKKISKMLDWYRIGREPYDPQKELLSLSIRLSQGTVEAFAIASDDHNTIEGAHGTLLFYIFDEAKTIPRPTWNAAEGAFANADIKNLQEKDPYIIEVPSTDDVYEESNGSRVEGDAENTSAISGMPAAQSIPDIRGILVPQNIGTYSAESPIARSSGESAHILPGRIPHKHSHPHNAKYSYLGDLPDTSAIAQFQAYAFAISTPGDPSGQFYDIHMHKPGFEHWKTRHVTVEEAIYAGRISASWVEQMRKQWGEDSSIFQNRVLGEFADVSDEGIIPLSWVRKAVERWRMWDSGGRGDMGDDASSSSRAIANVRKNVAGVDVARMGGDATVICLRTALVLTNILRFSKLPTTSTAGYVKRYCSGYEIHIETDGGLGAAVYDMLKEDADVLRPQYRLVPITVSAKTSWMDKSKQLEFVNVRAAMWWNMRELLDPENGSEVCLPPIDLLIADLATPRQAHPDRGGAVQIESKGDIKSRIGRSTDYGDACCLAFWNASRGGGVVI